MTCAASYMASRPMAVVSNSSPLIFYAKIGRLDILRNLFSTLLIPPAVYAEVAIAGAGRIGAAEIQGARRGSSAGHLHSQNGAKRSQPR